MSSPERPLPRRAGAWSPRIAAAGLLALSLGGCFRPLYGPTASGERVQDMLAAIDVAAIPAPPGSERLGHHLRSELVYELNGSGIERPKRYKLAIAVAERLQFPIVETGASRASAATLFVDATYTLSALDGAPVVTGRESSSATYDRSAQRFANVRAARDAQIRVSKDLASTIRLRLASALATRTP